MHEYCCNFGKSLSHPLVALMESRLSPIVKNFHSPALRATSSPWLASNSLRKSESTLFCTRCHHPLLLVDFSSPRSEEARKAAQFTARPAPPTTVRAGLEADRTRATRGKR